ncbi:MAG: ATP synthase F1 subunit gamma [Bacteroidales bacterium]|jgi:F-type H+-transporting ATPase subunit gamma|nr:ATP synthase F1 subunit gamma [Bacteroidales bacterium]MCK9499426.1 ATP synthase F1 subunit gamma [Bacteroidales bacterium]MDY0315451.1 ATP synthase F1 subunit gamma [Bacteroidales bacterium]NLB87427.1 ATP synthase F1 subunit gamma [Bacteroidales bacterium]
MSGLKDIRNRIASVKSTRQITSAMKMVSAAKLKKAQNMLVQIRPYSDKLKEVLQEVSSGLDKNHNNIFINETESKSVLIVLMASNRGLCGAFNTNICKKAISYVNENYSEQAEQGNVKFYCIGKKAVDYIKKTKFEIYKSEIEIFDNLTYSNTNNISESLMEIFANEEFDRIDLVYNNFQNAAVHKQIVEQYLPMTIEVEERLFPSDYIFEPGINDILDEMIPKFLKTQFYKTILDTNAAEHGARMTAMHQATDNATEMIKDLTLMYNKARQASITNEILEITSGAEALKG